MAGYILIASRDPFESREADGFFDLALRLAKADESVTLFLVQNGVLAARKGGADNVLSKLTAAGVKILADDFSLRERGIVADRVAASVKAAPIDVVIDHLAEGAKALWS